MFIHVTNVEGCFSGDPIFEDCILNIDQIAVIRPIKSPYLDPSNLYEIRCIGQFILVVDEKDFLRIEKELNNENESRKKASRTAREE